ncbi:MAG: hypothetical protein KJ737_08600 [Proteobacteria bacterium]|nr:hypothetical protein [Pseudomonadota bacterium]
MKKNNPLSMIMFIFVWVGSLMAITACDTSTTKLEWEHIYDEAETYAGPSTIFEARDGGYIVYDYSYVPNQSMLMKIDNQGNPLWQDIFDRDGALAFRETTDGGYLMKSIQAKELLLKKLDENRELIWQATYTVSANEDIKSSMWTDDGGCVISGLVDNDPEADTAFIVKLDALGGVEWKTTPENDFSILDCQASDGGFIAMTKTETEDGNQFWMHKLSASGEFLWSNIVHETAITRLPLGNVTFAVRTLYKFRDIKPLMAGGFIATGAIESIYMSDEGDIEKDNSSFVMKISDSGELIWRKSFMAQLGYETSYLTWKYAKHVIETVDKAYVVTGYGYKTGPDGAVQTLWMAKLSTNGVVLLDKKYDTDSEEPDSTGTALSATQDGGYIVAGLKGNSNRIMKFID